MPITDNRADKIKIKLPEKVFVQRNSLLTDLIEKDPNIRSVRNLFIVTFVGLFVQTLVYDYLKHGKVDLGLKIMGAGLYNFHFALFCWILYVCATCLIHPLFVLWARQREIFMRTNKTHIWDYFCLGFLIYFYVLSFRMVPVLGSFFKLGVASAASLVLEQVRLLMKVHSFVRTNVPAVLKFKPKSEENLKIPNFGKYFYFLFAPTLIYRDEYPRTKERRWSFIFYRALEIVAAIFYYGFLLNRFLIPSIAKICIVPYTVKDIIILICESTLSGTLMLFATFYLVLHSTQNLFAELLYFGDRLFYKDWWTSNSYAAFFRTWNVIVYDWLYTYIYKDIVEIIVPNNIILGKFAVFTLSALVHEWILINMFGFVLPILFCFYFVGVATLFIPSPKNVILNILFLYSCAFGSATIILLYAMEYVARLNVPLENQTIKNFLMPRLITADCVQF